jgi:hypothetical protein
MIEAICDCGAVRLEIAESPQSVLECGCTICRKLGTLWAYYSPRQVKLIPKSGATTIYLRGEREIEFHSCATCGCTTHWAAVDRSYDRMGVNARLMAPAVLAAAHLVKSAGPA